MNDKTKEKSLDFEKSLAKLESIIVQLEDGELPLNESIKTFEVTLDYAKDKVSKSKLHKLKAA